MSPSRRIEKLRPDHPIEGFDCGKEELNRYLLRYAWVNQQAGAAQTYVGLAGNTVAGYYTLAVGQVSREEAPERLIKGLARHPVPVMLLARLAVDKRWHGQGAGKSLLKDAMQRTLQAADIAGIRAFAVHAKDEEARNFYLKFDFIPSLPIPCTCSSCSRTCGRSSLEVTSAAASVTPLRFSGLQCARCP